MKLEFCFCTGFKLPMKLKKPFSKMDIDLETKEEYEVFYGWAYVCPNCQLRIKLGY